MKTGTKSTTAARNQYEGGNMIYGILYEKINDADFPEGYYYAHVPSLGLTTHGFGIKGAQSAAEDLIKLWISEKKANNETVVSASEMFYSTIEIDENVLQIA